MSFECKFCKKSFSSEKTLITHLCEPKRRWNNRKDRNVQLAFRCYQHFWRITSTAMKTERTYDDFMTSKYYTAFVKFANYLVDVYVASVEDYIEWLLKNRVKVDKWPSDIVYEQYIKEFAVRESVERAVERTVISMKGWGESNSMPWNVFFEKVSKSRCIHMIRSGQISPWLLYNSKTGISFLQSLNQQETLMIEDYIDPAAWASRFKKSQDDVSFVHEIVKKANI